ncbi:MAG: hypothetical protein ACLTSW_00165 [Coprococcus sp.]
MVKEKKDLISRVKEYRRTVYRISKGYTIYNNARREGCSRVLEEFTQNRIAQLRMQKNVSARDMSLTLEPEQQRYINQIENKKALPSLQRSVLYL